MPERGLRHQLGPLREEDPGLRRRTFRGRARGVRSRSQLVVDKCLHGSDEDISSIDVRLRHLHRFLRCREVQKCCAHCRLHLESRQHDAGPRPRDGSFRAGHRRVAESEVERLPRCQRTSGAAPHSLP
jgi:hypothetical protein